MLALMQRGMLAQFATQYKLFKGKYLVPVPPKRAPSAFILYGTEARKNIEGGSPVEKIRKIAAQWKELPDSQKTTYSKQAQQLLATKSKETESYNRKYKWPFQTVTARGLIMADFYKNNKFTNLRQGNEALKQHIEKMDAESKQAYNKKAAEQRVQKQKQRKHYEIPEPPYASFNSYLLSLRKADVNFPKKADLNDKQLQKHQNKYDAEMQKYKTKLQKFVESHEMSMKDFSKLVNKDRSKNQIEAEKKMIVAEKAKSEIHTLKKALKKGKQRLQKEKKNTARTANAQVKKITAQIDKVKNDIKKKTQKAQSAVEQAKKLKNKDSNIKIEDLKYESTQMREKRQGQSQ